MVLVNNMFGQDPADFNDEDAPSRIGHRIRKIREEKKIPLKALAAMIKTSADMLQKYENGHKKPKTRRLKEIALYLGVETLALTDPALTSEIGSMYALFELEEKHGLKLVKKEGQIFLEFPQNSSLGMHEFINKWYDKQESIRTRMKIASKEESQDLMREYHEWEWNFPNALDKNISKIELEKEKEALEKRLREVNEGLKDSED